MSTKIQCFIIDAQQDFTLPTGALYVDGANEDMQRLAAMINRLGSKIDDIHMTLDSHHLIDIAHPIFWIEAATGRHPGVFTIITHNDVVNGKYTTTNPRFLKRATEYVKQLEGNGRYPLCIWPPHCIIGSEGYALHPDIFKAVQKWEQENFAMANMVTKGSNFWTEHYSIFQADVPDPQDPSTMMNFDLVKALQEADVVAVAGEAASHCVSNSIRDLVTVFGDDNIKKLVLLEDCMSSVTGFENFEQQFFDDMRKLGVQIMKSTDFYA